MNFTLDSDNQFTLTCISTGGPATTVTLTRYIYYSHTYIEGTKTVLVDPTTAQYTHTLTVIWKMEGNFTCTVANDVSSVSSNELDVAGKIECTCTILTLFVSVPYSPRYLRVSQNGLNSLLLLWGPPHYKHGVIVTGYHISYQEQDGGHRGSAMTGGSNRTATITGLIAEATYSIRVAANSSTLPSYPTISTFTLSMCSPIAAAAA